jgi:hypothetical protein
MVIANAGELGTTAACTLGSITLPPVATQFTAKDFLAGALLTNS